MAPAVDPSDIVFPNLDLTGALFDTGPSVCTPTLSALLGDLKRSTLSVHNRLRSIREDADFVAEASAAFGRPLVANERCGGWYIRPENKAASAYFKSTDGHAGAWKFSLRRLNLPLLDLIEKHDGCIIVDSTRRGKRMPDALSKTVPIWCAVLNAVLFPLVPASHALHTPPNVVSPSEHDSIAALLPSFVASFRALGLDLDLLAAAKPSKPLRPAWVTRDSHLPAGDGGGAGTVFEEYRPVICCTASRRVDGEIGEGGYVQGAADDAENWAAGLTAPVFWSHARELVDSADADLPALVARLAEEHERENQERQQNGGGAALVHVGSGVYVCPLPLPEALVSADDCRIVVSPQVTERASWVGSPGLMDAGLGRHKTASRNLRRALPDMASFVAGFLDSKGDENGTAACRVVVACESGKDLSVGVALGLLCSVYDERGRRRPGEPRCMGKRIIKSKTADVMARHPEANPSRATLQSVNSFVMGRRDGSWTSKKE